MSLGIFDPTPLGKPAQPPKSSSAKPTGKTVIEKPKRPLSAYNIFFRDERKRILDSLPESSPRKSNSKSKKSKKPHGKISFQQLATLVGKRWKEADAETRVYYFGLANEQKLRYFQALQDYHAYLDWLQQEDTDKQMETTATANDWQHLDSGIPALAEQLGKELTDLVVNILS